MLRDLYSYAIGNTLNMNGNEQRISMTSFQNKNIGEGNIELVARNKYPKKILRDCLSYFITEGMKTGDYSEIVVLNLGVRDKTYDSLGPLVGSKLCGEIHEHSSGVIYVVDNRDNIRRNLKFKGRRFKVKHGTIRPNITIYGTLLNPVHSGNYHLILQKMDNEHKNPFIIATDTSMRKSIEETGDIIINDTPIQPGLQIYNDNPFVGNVSIRGAIGVDTRTYIGNGSNEVDVLQWMRQELSRNGDYALINAIANVISQTIAYCLLSNPKELRMSEKS